MLNKKKKPPKQKAKFCLRNHIKMLLLKILLLMSTIASSFCFTTDLPALRSILNFFGVGLKAGQRNMTLAELGRSQGQCNYDFFSLMEQREKFECAADDYYIQHLLTRKQPTETSVKKPPILVKCLQPPYDSIENATSEYSSNFTTGQLLIMKSVKEIVALLKPIGNSTKRHEAGSCVLVFFHSPTSLSCAQVAPYANVLPALFPTLRVAAIDAFVFSSFNTEFGIVGLPTLLLFHQGRPIVKFYSDIGTFAAFVTRHTGIKPLELAENVTETLKTGPLPLEPIEQVDLLLILAWGFILLCVGNYILKTRWCLNLIDVIKRNWRESEEAQMEPN